MSGLVIGKSGQLASHLRSILPDATFWGRKELDLADPVSIVDLVSAVTPAYLVNAAAYTAVDQAESEPELAWLVNCEGPRQLAIAATRLGIPLIHVSTDYVFDGDTDLDYTDVASTHPVNVYGASKLAGELAIASHCEKHRVIRASWLFSEYGNNFVKTMLRLGQERPALSIVGDQIGMPTYAGDLAALIGTILQKDDQLRYGVFHFSGGKPCSWYDFARHIFDQARARDILSSQPQLTSIPTSEYPTDAVRPMRTIMQGSRELESVEFPQGNWSVGLATMLDQYASD